MHIHDLRPNQEQLGKINTKLPLFISRGWNRPLWNKLFDMFLNIPSCDDLPSVAAIRQELQKYLKYLEMDDDGEESIRDMREIFCDTI